MVQSKEERKAWLKNYNSRPENKAKAKVSQKKYLESDKGHETIAKRLAKPDVKAKIKKNRKKYFDFL